MGSGGEDRACPRAGSRASAPGTKMHAPPLARTSASTSRPSFSKISPMTTPISDPISLDISPANGGMSGNQGGWDEGQAPEGQTRRQRTDARSDRGRPAGALERTAEDGVGVAVTAR